MVAYPTTDRAALRRAGARDRGDPDGAPVVMVDSREQLDLIDAAAATAAADAGRDRAGRRLLGAGGRVKIGAKRSPLRTPEQAAAWPARSQRRARLRLVGLMAYEGAHRRGGDRPRAARSAPRCAPCRRAPARAGERRAAVVAAVRAVRRLELVNGGGTGSLAAPSREAAVTEVAAGSGLYGPTLFDAYPPSAPAGGAVRPAGGARPAAS